jgi:hypothetical protein
MSMAPVLARGVRIVAEIQHSHGVKAAVSVQHLRLRFPHWTEAFWRAALQRAKWFDEPTVEMPVSAPALPMSPQRARLILARRVVPACYSAVRSWAEASGAQEVIAHCLDQACADPQYLGHRLSVLLALHDAWPAYRGGPDQVLFLDRLTEFVIACGFQESAQPGPTQSANWEAASAAALERPGFFGHHAICLSWISRSRDLLGPDQLANALAWVARASATPHADAEDNILITPAAAPRTEAALEEALRSLLLRGVRNIHLLTLADAVAWLWVDAPDEARARLLGLAAAFSRPGAA